MLVLLQAVDHPYLVLYSATSQALEGCHDYAASKTDCGLCGGFEAEDVVVCYVPFVSYFNGFCARTNKIM